MITREPHAASSHCLSVCLLTDRQTEKPRYSAGIPVQRSCTVVLTDRQTDHATLLVYLCKDLVEWFKYELHKAALRRTRRSLLSEPTTAHRQCNATRHKTSLTVAHMHTHRQTPQSRNIQQSPSICSLQSQIWCKTTTTTTTAARFTKYLTIYRKINLR